MDYFESAYFDGTYFDCPSDRTPAFRRLVPTKAPEPASFDDPDAEWFLLLTPD